MKTIKFCVTLILAFILLPAISDGKPISLQLKKNQEMVYEWNLKNGLFLSENPMIPNELKIVRFSFLVNKIEKNKAYLTAQFLQNVSDRPKSTGYFNDIRFPLIQEYVGKSETDLAEEALFQAKFQIVVDLTTYAIELTNRVDILEQCFAILKNKGCSEEEISNTVGVINRKALQEKYDLLLFPFLFRYAETDQSNIYIKELKTAFSSVTLDEKQVELKSNSGIDEPVTNCILDPRDGILTSYTKETTFKVRQNGVGSDNQGMKRIEKITLLQKSLKKPQRLIVCGHIENPVSNQIELYSLGKPFGTDMDTKVVSLDGNKNFKVEIKFENRGLVLVTNPNKNQNVPGPVVLLYAEPGDSLYFQAGLGIQKFQQTIHLPNDSVRITYQDYAIPETISFSGDRQYEGELLNQFWKQAGFKPLRKGGNSFYLEKSWPNAKVYLDILAKLEKLMSDFRGKMSNESATYINHELQASLYSCLLSSRPRIPMPGFYTSSAIDLDRDIMYSLQSQLDTFNIYRIYNDYGIFSRNLTTDYINYKFNRLSTTVVSRSAIFESMSLGKYMSAEQGILLSRLVLSGSPYYREVAGRVCRFSPNYFGEIVPKTKQKLLLDENITQMLRFCNDQLFISSLKKIKSNLMHWDDKLYIPDVVFLNLQKQKTTCRSLIQKKTTIFCSAGDWTSSRYEMDDMAAKFPEINFVLINQGSNFDLWKNWNDRAEPVAQQLFLMTDSLRLEDVFLENYGHFLVYNSNGERIGNTKSLPGAIQVAKGIEKSQKKEVNKSTLKIIILILSGSLVLFLILFFLYKYRMRQRLKKQEQEKRFRELQMAAIRAQMNPHFLFNSLNSVQNLIQQNKGREAHLYLSDFAGLIRKVLRNSDKEEVSLEEELEMVEQYLKLEQLRFGFEYRIEVDNDIDKGMFMLPSMILQPLAENALMHGLQHKTGDKKLLIRIFKIEDAIQVTVEDNGIGLQQAQTLKTKSNGVGLRMNKERIQMMKEKYGGNYSFKLIDLLEQGGVGTRVEIVVPEEN